MEMTDNIDSRLDPNRIPQHVAIIMDGNGRWARNRDRGRSEGHAEGVNSVNRITRISSILGIRYLTLYAFSTENWNRPQEEVDALMNLIGWTIAKETPDLVANNVKIKLLGDIDRLPVKAREALAQGVDATRHCTGLTLILCISYSARWELADAARRLARKVREGIIEADSITEDMFAAHLATAGIPDPDLLIRTGGEYRISNFLLWQIAYSELYFTPTLWPDFDREAFIEAIADFQSRERRFGKTGEQVRGETNSDSPNI